ncbi:MAG: diguanylate cyclase [Allobaculum sp.]|nr:diguanylate cyclase [Allobaculum sp.]
MKRFKKWKDLFNGLSLFGLLFSIISFVRQEWLSGITLALASIAVYMLFNSFWQTLSRKGIQSDVEISRVLGRDAKEALIFGEVGLITYNDEYVVTWVSDYLKAMNVDIVNQKVTAFFNNIRELFENEIDTIVGEHKGHIYEVKHKVGTQVLFVKNITEIVLLEQRLQHGSMVIGQLNLDGYDQYQSSDNEELLNSINTRLRGQLISWAKENGILMRRIRSDRYLVIMDSEILQKIRSQNFAILQRIKDISAELDISVTLSMALVENLGSLLEVDRALTDVMEIIQSRGGDQVAIKDGTLPIEFIGGNSEKALQPSKVRVRIVNSSIQDLIRHGGRVFILGHVNTDFDAMGGALAMSNWVRALHRDPYIVLKNVPRDHQLQETLDEFGKAINRHNVITEDRALEMYDPEKDLVVMVDHSNPLISSGKRLLDLKGRTIIIDHHRRSENYPDNVLTAYIESKASSTCEMMTELLQASPISVPIYEFEATIMYLGILVDTGRFKSHTSERTFQAAGILRSWGANAYKAEQALKETYTEYRRRSSLMEQAQVYREHFFIDVLSEPVSRTLLSQISDGLLKFKGCWASFTIGINAENGRTAISARSNGRINVQRIMERMNGGGHFSAAASERSDLTPQEAANVLKRILDEQLRQLEQPQEDESAKKEKEPEEEEE